MGMSELHQGLDGDWSTLFRRIFLQLSLPAVGPHNKVTIRHTHTHLSSLLPPFIALVKGATPSSV